MPDAPLPLRHALLALAHGRSLALEEAAEVFHVVMRGEATAAQVGALLLGLRAKGETADEVAGAARALRATMVRVLVEQNHLVDTCGTGGGAVPTFNISTAAALVAAGAGAAVAKHGNRSFTSQCGSADVLEALGVSLSADAAAAAAALRRARMAFLFAPNFHPAMRHVGPVRRELGVPTVMNLLGPLANPAGVRRQVIGVADPDRAPLLADALHRLGAEHAVVVHGRVGMDEISPVGTTGVWEIRDGEVRTWELDAARFGCGIADPTALRGGDPRENADRVVRLLEGRTNDAAGQAAVVLNAAAALYVAGLVRDYADGIDAARTALAAGAGRETLERLRISTSG